MNLMPGLESTASALDAERLRMNVVAENIANAFTTKGPGGTPYKRKIVDFESVLTAAQTPGSTQAPTSQVNVRGVVEDQTPGKLVYNPGHPDADEKGMVEMPNVEMSREMVDLIVSSRAYEANTQAARIARQMAKTALTIGNKS
ncbi:MAG TPA: flagellar basal body rod protein FlgC [Opitutales bacterium]|nr:flagellar basal body rod protein FlgC [Opitutales bacterium]